jgi:hypothetical protein
MPAIFAKFVRLDDWGAEIETIGEKPKNCPGCGGWKSNGNAWWTRVKGPKALEIEQVAFCNDGYVVIDMDGDKIINVGV